MSILTKRTYKSRCKRLDSLMADINYIHGRTSFLLRHARPYSAARKGSDFWKNFHYKSTLELLRAATWTLYHLAKMRIEQYKKEEAEKL